MASHEAKLLLSKTPRGTADIKKSCRDDESYDDEDDEEEEDEDERSDEDEEDEDEEDEEEYSS